MFNKKDKRIGETRYNKNGSKMTIIDCYHVVIKFDDGYIRETQYSNFKAGNVMNPYDRSVYGIGYMGEGKYQTSINYKNTPQYETWRQMLRRCYSKEYLKKFPTYKECTVCEEWHSFQNFAKWYDENFYQIKNETMNLDKDILHKRNKIYSPENCVFVPQLINELFTKRQNCRGDLPIGVTVDSKYPNKYISRCQNNTGNAKKLGKYNTINEAFNTYKNYKEKLIKKIADEYKNKIPQKLYDALYKYEVEITD